MLFKYVVGMDTLVISAHFSFTLSGITMWVKFLYLDQGQGKLPSQVKRNFVVIHKPRLIVMLFNYLVGIATLVISAHFSFTLSGITLWVTFRYLDQGQVTESLSIVVVNDLFW